MKNTEYRSSVVDGTKSFVNNAFIEPSARVSRGIQFEEPLIFERSVTGRRGFTLCEADWDVPRVEPENIWAGSLIRTNPAALPEVSEPEVIRHYTRMSQWNYAIDTGLYPLGSCTMKYNPKINESVARYAGFTRLHPYMPDSWCQGALELLFELEQLLCNIAGLPYCSLQPAAGAQGELTGLMCIRAYHESRGDHNRTKIIVPESAHGTNPATAAFNGYSVVEVRANKDTGFIDAQAIASVMDETVAGLMITNPNTMGIFEAEIAEICAIVHAGGGKVYMDGANMNAILGQARPGDFGIDVMHYNVHKTFSTPHGGGGPGGGPICVSHDLAPFLPVPRVEKIASEGEHSNTYRLSYKYPESIGKVKAFWGNFLVYVRAYTYLREYGSDLPQISRLAVLNANYVRALLKDDFYMPYGGESMHEVVFDDSSFKDYGVATLDIAKRLIDYGFYPPTIYFPLNVRGAMMIEPTETETKAELDEFVAAMKTILAEARECPELLKGAPYNAYRTRLDETTAARNPILTYAQYQQS